MLIFFELWCKRSSRGAVVLVVLPQQQVQLSTVTNLQLYLQA
jgi:hypothetical protein